MQTFFSTQKEKHRNRRREKGFNFICNMQRKVLITLIKNVSWSNFILAVSVITTSESEGNSSISEWRNMRENKKLCARDEIASWCNGGKKSSEFWIAFCYAFIYPCQLSSSHHTVMSWIEERTAYALYIYIITIKQARERWRWAVNFLLFIKQSFQR